MIVMREILNVKQTQVHPGDASFERKRNEGREKGIRDRGFNQNLPFLHLI